MPYMKIGKEGFLKKTIVNKKLKNIVITRKKKKYINLSILLFIEVNF